MNAFLETKDGNRIPISKPSLVIGREETCDIAVDSPAVSRNHAKITLENEKLYLEDLNSSNGTVINGRRMDKGEKTELADGDVVVFATKLTLTIRIEKPAAVPAAETKNAALPGTNVLPQQPVPGAQPKTQAVQPPIQPPVTPVTPPENKKKNNKQSNDNPGKKSKKGLIIGLAAAAAVVIAAVLVLVFVVFGESKEARAVDALIQQIGTVTLDSKQAILDAHTAYDALSADDKEDLKNTQVLIDAEAAYADLYAEDVGTRLNGSWVSMTAGMGQETGWIPDVGEFELGEVNKTDCTGSFIGDTDGTWAVNSDKGSYFWTADNITVTTPQGDMELVQDEGYDILTDLPNNTVYVKTEDYSEYTALYFQCVDITDENEDEYIVIGSENAEIVASDGQKYTSLSSSGINAHFNATKSGVYDQGLILIYQDGYSLGYYTLSSTDGASTDSDLIAFDYLYGQPRLVIESNKIDCVYTMVYYFQAWFAYRDHVSSTDFGLDEHVITLNNGLVITMAVDQAATDYNGYNEY